MPSAHRSACQGTNTYIPVCPRCRGAGPASAGAGISKTPDIYG